MAADTVQIELTAQDAKAVAAWQRQKDNIESFEKQLDKTAAKSKQVGESNVGMGEQAMAGFGKTVTAMIGVGSIVQAWTTAVALVTAEINNAIDRQKDAASANLSLPQAQRQLFANIGKKSTDLGETAAERNRAGLKMAEKLSKEAGISAKDATTLLSEAFSLREGNDTSQDVYNAAKAGAVANPDDMQIAGAMSAGALGIRRGRQNITPEQSIGYIQEAGAVLPISDPAKASKLLSRSLNAVEAAGGDERFSAAFAGTAATSAKDTEGDKTATFVVNYLTKLNKAATGKRTPLEQIEAIIPRGASFAKDKDEFDKLDLSSTRTEEETRRFNQLKTKHAAFLSLTETGEAAFNPFSRDLLSGGESWKNLQANIKDVPSFAESGSLYKENVAAANVSDQVQLSRFNRVLAGGVEKEKLANTSGAAAAIARDQLAEFAKAAGDSALAQDVQRFLAGVESLGEQDVATTVGRTTEHFQGRRASLLTPTEGDYGGSEFSSPGYMPGKAELAQADRIAVMLEALIGLATDLKENGVKAEVKTKNSGPDPRLGAAPRPAASLGGNGV
jgi:hypothetical protein